MPGPAPRPTSAPPALDIALLDRLRAAGGGFVTLDELAMAGSSRGADPSSGAIDRVGAGLDALASFGFAIERHPYRGAAYRGPAGRLCPDQVEHELATRRIGRRIVVWSRVSSTNDLAASAVGSADDDGLVVLAEEQTAGRGRRGRSWTAPPRSSILMSVLLIPDSDPAQESADGRGWLTALAAVATAEVVDSFAGRRADVKWPNDVRIAGRKIAGILVECPTRDASPGATPASSDSTGRPAVIGIGLNVNIDRDDLSADLRDRATSIRLETGASADRSEVARALIRRLDHWYESVRMTGIAALNAAWRGRMEGIGGLVRVTTPSGPRSGRFVDLDLRLGLTLQLAPGSADSRVHIALSDVLAVELG
jgi:BirA family transcriptional regulator, biotin operon repressor / biotin---[acetyl-CoA-carboxylase] ligase